MENISLYEFKLLPQENQYDFVFTNGDFITNREDGGSQYVLYALHRFFVEIEYDIQINEIVKKEVC